MFHVQIQTAWISIRYDFTEFSLGSACSLSEEVLVRITSIRTGDCLVCFFAASAAKFWKPLEARRTEHFPFSLVIFLVAQIPTKRGVLVHKNSLASYQWCRHSIEPCALTCPFRQSDLIAWSLLSWHPTHKYLWGRLCFLQIRCLLSTVTVTPAEIRIMSTEACVFKTVLVKIHTNRTHMAKNGTLLGCILDDTF